MNLKKVRFVRARFEQKRARCDTKTFSVLRMFIAKTFRKQKTRQNLMFAKVQWFSRISANISENLIIAQIERYIYVSSLVEFKENGVDFRNAGAKGGGKGVYWRVL
jgi:hypothetical protein